jgi:hypothetical protein
MNPEIYVCYVKSLCLYVHIVVIVAVIVCIYCERCVFTMYLSSSVSDDRFNHGRNDKILIMNTIYGNVLSLLSHSTRQTISNNWHAIHIDATLVQYLVSCQQRVAHGGASI